MAWQFLAGRLTIPGEFGEKPEKSRNAGDSD